ncbi:MAG: hypothetical protein ABFD91_12560 [Anaerohalosphaeraceae bacterium]
MRLLPWDAFGIRTTMSQEEAVRRLDLRIGYPGAGHFHGQIRPEGFTISRMIRFEIHSRQLFWDNSAMMMEGWLFPYGCGWI